MPTSRRHLALASIAAAMLLSLRAEAQALGSGEKLEESFRERKFVLAKKTSAEAPDGTQHRLYENRGLTKIAGGLPAMLEVFGSREAPVKASLILPTAVSPSVLVLLSGTFISLVCEKEVKCPQNDVLTWAAEALKAEAKQARRFGAIDFEILPPAASLGAVFTITADGRPAIRDAEAAASAAERERKIREEAEQRRTDAARDLDAAITEAGAQSDVAATRALYDRIGAADISDDARARLHGRIGPMLVRARIAATRRAIERGDLREAHNQLAEAGVVAQQLSATADEAAVGREVGEARRILAKAEARGVLDEATRAEERNEFRVAKRLYADAAGKGVPEGSAGVERIEGQRRSPSIAMGLSVIPGGGQVYGHRYGAAAAYFASTAVTAGAGALLLKSANSQYQSYLAATDSQHAQDAYRATQTRLDAGYTLLGVGAVLWIINVVDAGAGAATWNQENLGDK